MEFKVGDIVEFKVTRGTRIKFYYRVTAVHTGTTVSRFFSEEAYLDIKNLYSNEKYPHVRESQMCTVDPSIFSAVERAYHGI